MVSNFYERHIGYLQITGTLSHFFSTCKESKKTCLVFYNMLNKRNYKWQMNCIYRRNTDPQDHKSF